MRPGLAVSAGTHALLLGIGLVSLGWAEALPPPPVESIAVDLVPIAAFANIRVGDLNSTLVETDAPSAVDTDQAAELAKRTGNTEEDQPVPKPTETPSPSPSISSAPEPVPEPEPEPDPVPAAAAPPPPEPEPVPEPAPQRVALAEPEPTPAPRPEPAPAPVPELAAPLVEPEPSEVAPAPAMRTAALDKMRADFKKQQEADAKAAAEEKKRKDAEAKAAEDKKRKEAEAKRLAEAKAAEQKQANLADDISDIINREDSRGAVSGEGGQKSLGKADGKAATLTQSELESLGAAMRVCFSPPLGAAEEGATATLYVTFNPDGSVSGADVRGVTGALGNSTANAAIRAARRCGPYALVAQRYDELFEAEVLFDPARQ